MPWATLSLRFYEQIYFCFFARHDFKVLWKFIVLFLSFLDMTLWSRSLCGNSVNYLIRHKTGRLARQITLISSTDGETFYVGKKKTSIDEIRKCDLRFLRCKDLPISKWFVWSQNVQHSSTKSIYAKYTVKYKQFTQLKQTHPQGVKVASHWFSNKKP